MENNKKYLEKGSKAMVALRKIVLDPKWLNTLHYYVGFIYLLGVSGGIDETVIYLGLFPT